MKKKRIKKNITCLLLYAVCISLIKKNLDEFIYDNKARHIMFISLNKLSKMSVHLSCLFLNNDSVVFSGKNLGKFIEMNFSFFEHLGKCVSISSKSYHKFKIKNNA